MTGTRCIRRDTFKVPSKSPLKKHKDTMSRDGIRVPTRRSNLRPSAIPATCQGQRGCLNAPTHQVYLTTGTIEYPCVEHMPIASNVFKSKPLKPSDAETGDSYIDTDGDLVTTDESEVADA